MDYKETSLKLHEQHKGKIETKVKFSIQTKDDLSVAYTPGVAAVCEKIAKNPEAVYTHTIKANTVAIITDGSAVLGLGNIGPEAALPVMEGKAALLKEFANVDAFPICLNTQDSNEIIQTVKRISPVFGGINLEDISAPRCFEIEAALQDLGIPVMHDDQHGTAIVVLAGLINALKLTNQELSACKIIINGAGAAAVAVTKLLLAQGAQNIIMLDSKGILSKSRNLDGIKKEMTNQTNPNNIEGSLTDAIKGANIFIGVSKGNVLTKEMVESMNKDPIIFALANPQPEIDPEDAKSAGAKIIATGRSDYPNQVNNVLAFPGLFRGALDAGAPRITEDMKLRAAQAIAKYVENPTVEKILPSPLDKNVANVVAEEVKRVV